MVTSSITVPDTFEYKIEEISSEFVARSVRRDRTVFDDYVAVIGDTVFVCLNQSPSNTTPVDVLHRIETPSLGLRRIQARQAEIIHRARELRSTFGDPVDRLTQVLQAVPVDDGVWDRIAQEPYG